MSVLRWAKKARGFTLIEIAIVVAIIGLLLLISLPLFSGARNRAYVAEARQILSEGKSLLWSCLVEHNFAEASCNSPSAIGWSNRPTSDVWDTSGVTLTINNNCTGTLTGSHSLKLTADGDPLGPGVSFCVYVTESNGKVTEVVSGL